MQINQQPKVLAADTYCVGWQISFPIHFRTMPRLNKFVTVPEHIVFSEFAIVPEHTVFSEFAIVPEHIVFSKFAIVSEHIVVVNSLSYLNTLSLVNSRVRKDLETCSTR